MLVVGTPELRRNIFLRGTWHKHCRLTDIYLDLVLSGVQNPGAEVPLKLVCVLLYNLRVIRAPRPHLCIAWVKRIKSPSE